MINIADQKPMTVSDEPVHTIELSEGPFDAFILNAILNASGGSEDAMELMMREVFAAIREQGAAVLSLDAFGEQRYLEKCRAVLDIYPDAATWPANWVLSVEPGGPTSLQLHCIRGATVTRLRHGERFIGSLYENAHARHCRLAGVLPDDVSRSPEEQTRQTFETFTQTLNLASMNFGHVVRTWFYNDNILDWYAGFNRVRREFYEAAGVFEGLIPASTGIGGANLHGAALTSGLLAVAPKDGAVKIQMVSSPRQGAALEYGSVFSRAVELGCPGCRHLIVSGTASILPDGRTASVGDIEAQIELTMEVVEGILKSRGMGWNEVFRKIAYLSKAEYLAVFDEYSWRHAMPRPLMIEAVNHICREDLLFEIEIDAVSGEDVR